MVTKSMKQLTLISKCQWCKKKTENPHIFKKHVFCDSCYGKAINSPNHSHLLNESLCDYL